MRTLTFCSILWLCLSVSALAQTTEFTYQGRLLDNQAPANTNYDFEFRLFANQTDPPNTPPLAALQRLGVPVNNGVFSVRLDFGAQFTGAARYLEIAVKAAGGTSFTTLTPRQPVTSAPYSVKSLSAASADSLSTTCVLCVTDAQIQSLAGNKLTGVITGNGSGLTNLNGASINAGSVTSVQLSSDAVPNSGNLKLLGSLRWDLLKGQSSFPVSGGPSAIAFDGANMWVVNLLSDNVSKLRASDGANLGTFAVGNNPSGIAFDGANIWVTNISSNNVTKLRASDGANLGTFSVGNGPIGIVFDGNNVWVTSLNGNVAKLRAGDGSNLGSFPAGLNQSAIAFDGENIWVTNQTPGTVTKLRASDGVNLGSFSANGNPRAIAFDGANMWVANDGSNNATRLPPAFPQ